MNIDYTMYMYCTCNYKTTYTVHVLHVLSRTVNRHTSHKHSARIQEQLETLTMPTIESDSTGTDTCTCTIESDSTVTGTCTCTIESYWYMYNRE